MRLARELEKRLERLVDGVSGAIFRGRVHPVDLGTRIVRDADLNMIEGPAGPVVPNDYQIALNPQDLAAVGAGSLATELTHTLAATAVERGWRLEGPPHIEVVPEPSVKPNHMKMLSRIAPGELDPWGQLIGTGRHAELRANRVLIGRAADCDVRLPDAEVSRRHAIIYRAQHRTWITDLDSSNGTTVDGIGVTNSTPLRPGAQLTIGPVSFMFRLVEP